MLRKSLLSMMTIAPANVRNRAQRSSVALLSLQQQRDIWVMGLLGQVRVVPKRQQQQQQHHYHHQSTTAATAGMNAHGRISSVMMMSTFNSSSSATTAAAAAGSKVEDGVEQAEQKNVRDTIIIGSGPAGYTAALYTARAQMKPLMIAGVQYGGQLQLTSDVENFPGYAEAVSGPDLMEDLRKQAERFGTEMMYRDVTSVDLSHRPFRVSVRKKDFFAKSIIIATGAEAVWLGAEGEEDVKGKGVSTCATCDGAFYEGKEVIVVGGGDSAMEEALFLTKFASKVTVVHRRDGFRSSKIMLQRVESHPKISLKLHRTVKRWVSEGGELSGAELEDPRGKEAAELLPCSGAFIAIGHKPMTKFLSQSPPTSSSSSNGRSSSSSSRGGSSTGVTLAEGEEDPAHARRTATVELDHDGFIVQREHTMTSVEGVFACGDVVDRRYRQAISAAGMGCQAAIDCERWLADEE